jgi:hypothetical protein
VHYTLISFASFLHTLLAELHSFRFFLFKSYLQSTRSRMGPTFSALWRREPTEAVAQPQHTDGERGTAAPRKRKRQRDDEGPDAHVPPWLAEGCARSLKCPFVRGKLSATAYGADFATYPADPSFSHSTSLVHVLEGEEAIPLARRLIVSSRIAHSVRKSAVFTIAVGSGRLDAVELEWSEAVT